MSPSCLERPVSRLAPPLWLAAMFLLPLLGCSEDPRRPELLPVDPQTVAVNAPLRLTLAVENPDGLALDWRVEDPGLPSFAEVSSLAGTPSGADFQWTPLVSHVGEHELVFHVDSEAGASEVAVLVTVTAADSAAPVFLRPGFGGTFDLQREPCVRFDIEVRDDDSLDVELRAREPLPEGAELVPAFDTSKRAAFEWCPAEAQIERSLRWNIALEADDGDHEPATAHDYLVVLRTPERTNCPGTAPVITVTSPAEGATLSAPGGYPVDITIDDDTGVRDQPILYFTTKSPGDEPDLADFDQRLFEPLGGNAWRAVVPPLELAEGESRTLYFFVEATDNDDAMGTSCDHRSETPVSKFTAAPATGQTADDCSPCTASSQCTSGICATLGGGGTCLPACGAGDSCASGTCASATTVAGQSVPACAAVCATVEPGECTADAFEPNDGPDSASTLPGNSVEATVCGGDTDYWRLEASDGDLQLQLTLDGFDTTTADLDLALVDAAGTLLELTSGTSASETLAWCLPAGQDARAVVFGYLETDQSDYTLTVDQAPGNCCVDDAFEPDSQQSEARAIGTDGSFDGTLCAPDDDWLSFAVTGPQSVEILVVYDAADGMDLDLELHGPDGALLAGAWNDNATEESLTHDVSVAGTYTLRVVPFAAGSGSYLGSVTLGAPAGCASTLECALFSVCSDAGECVPDQCTSAFECPTDHSCPAAGPGLSQGYCAADCATNAECRDGEACKWFTGGVRGCGQKGAGLNGASCTFFEDCGGQRDCVAWPGGYCARAGCASNADCESDTFCAAVGGQNLCVKRCGAGQPECRLAEGYACTAVASTAATMEQGCIAP